MLGLQPRRVGIGNLVWIPIGLLEAGHPMVRYAQPCS